MTFEELNLQDTLLRAVKAEGYTTPTPIQAQAIPHVLAGKDVLGCAQTGTGKTAAFALPILQRLGTPPQQPRPIRCLVLTPTRELASQIGDSFATYGRHTALRHTVIFGGVGQEPQVSALRKGVDVLVATPGRLLDLMSQRMVSFHGLEILVLDEADRMLDMGFIHDVKRIIAAVPRKRQTLFFSATMPPDIVALSRSILVDPVRIEVTPLTTTAETVDQRIYFVEKTHKRSLLVHVLGDAAISRALVFTRTKSGANRVTRHLQEAGVEADVIHGNKSQNARERALDSFKDGAIRVLVATDIAARGIDVDGISHVINFDLPNIPESYVHRIGRTGRAGATGIALSFCDSEERAFLRDIERTIRLQVQVIEDHPYHSRGGASAPTRDDDRPQPSSRGNGRRGQSSSRPGGGGGRGGHGGGHRAHGGSSSPRPAASPSAPLPPPKERYAPKWF
ncbi:MAG: DEAD/DEAH box helicase [Myxococcaceae bacterium]